MFDCVLFSFVRVSEYFVKIIAETLPPKKQQQQQQQKNTTSNQETSITTVTKWDGGGGGYTCDIYYVSMCIFQVDQEDGYKIRTCVSLWAKKKKKMVCWHSQLCSIGELSDLCFLFSAFMACFVFCFLQRIYGLPGMPIFTTATNTAVQHHSTTPSFMEEVSASNCAALLLGLLTLEVF